MKPAMIIASVVMALACGILLAQWLLGFAKQSRAKAKAVHSAGSDARIADRVIRDGIAILLPIAKQVLRVRQAQAWAVQLSEACLIKGMPSRPEAMVSVVLAAEVAIACAATIISSSLLAGLMASCCALLLVGSWSRKVIDQRDALMHDQLPEALQAMKGCFSVGFSLPQTFQQVSEEVGDPLAGVFRRATAVLETGGTIEEALGSIKRASHDEELAFVATALEIQHRTGSSMQHVLSSTIATVKEELALRRSLRTQTAQAKLSAQIVSLMPFLLIGVFSLVSPGFLDPFFESAAGVTLLAVAVAMQVAGIVSVRHMLAFKEA